MDTGTSAGNDLLGRDELLKTSQTEMNDPQVK